MSNRILRRTNTDMKARLDKLKAIVFDFDGTLAVLNIDFSEMKDRVFEIMRRYPVDQETIKETFLLEIIDEVCRGLREAGGSGADEFYEQAHRILHTIEMKAAGEGRLLEGTEGMLEKLRSRGLKIGIVTRNCEDAVRKVFPAIDKFCDAFISRNSTRKVKPHPDHLTAVMKALGISGEEAAMVGDHLIDIQAGKSAGMVTIGVLTGRIGKHEFQQTGADYVLKEASEICNLLAG